MPPPVKINWRKSPTPAPPNGKSRRLTLPPHPRKPREFDIGTPLQLTIAVVFCTTVFIAIAAYWLPDIPKKGQVTIPEEVVPLPPIGMSQPQARQESARRQPPAAEAPVPSQTSSAAGKAVSQHGVAAVASQLAQRASQSTASQSEPAMPSQQVADAQSPPASQQDTSTSQPGRPSSSVLEDVEVALKEVAKMAETVTDLIDGTPKQPSAPTEENATSAPGPSPADEPEQPAATPQQSTPLTLGPITAEQRAHVNALAEARVTKQDGRCFLLLTTQRPMMRYKWLELDKPRRVAIDFIGIWEAKDLKRNIGVSGCVKAMRVGNHYDRLRVVVELGDGAPSGPPAPSYAVLIKRSDSELLVTLPRR